MRNVIAIDHQQDWFEVPGALVVTARGYLSEPDGGFDGSVRLLNLCRTGRYQGRGYYVSLLAEARGQRPLPDVKTVEDLKSGARVQALSAELQPLMNETLHDEGDSVELDVYLGKDPARRHQALADQLFTKVRAPLLRARCRRTAESWFLEAVQAIGVDDIPAQHRDSLLDAATAFVGETSASHPPRTGRPRLAILWDPNEPHKPSNEEALHRLVQAAAPRRIAERRHGAARPSTP